MEEKSSQEYDAEVDSSRLVMPFIRSFNAHAVLSQLLVPPGNFTSNMVTISGLLPDNDYQFKVKARNALGLSDFSPMSPVVSTSSSADVVSILGHGASEHESPFGSVYGKLGPVVVLDDSQQTVSGIFLDK